MSVGGASCRWTALACLATLWSCGPKPPVVVIIKTPDGKVIEAPPAPDVEHEQAAERIARSAGEFEAKGERAAAELKRDQLLREYPGTAAGALELERRAQKARSAGHLNQAREYYETLLLHRPTFVRAAVAREAYGELLLQAGRSEDAVNVLRPLFDSATDPTQKARLGSLLSEALAGGTNAREALEIQVALRTASGLTEAQHLAAAAQAKHLVARKVSFGAAEKLWRDIGADADWAFLHPLLAYKLAKIYYHARDYDESRKMLELVVRRYGDSDLAKPAGEFLRRLNARFKVDPGAIGVVLPLSGRFLQYGERSLAAIHLAFAGSKVRLVVKDTAGDPTVAAKAVEDLVLRDHVMAIIGPQFSKPSMAAALKAEELSVAILCLSHREGLPQIGPHVFRTALTVRAQAEALARLAFDELGMSRFALLYPENPYGFDFIQAFWDAVDRRKGEIRAVESYEQDQTTFSEEARMLVGRRFRDARKEYVDKSNELRQLRLPPHKYKEAIQEFLKTLPPVVDFDAIIIPDSGRKIGLIAPALAFEDIVMTRDPKLLATIRKTTGNKEVRPVTLMGGSTWNSAQILESCERYCEDAIFVDGYFGDSPNPRVRQFVSAFREATGAEALLSDAQAFDTAKLIRELMDSAKPRDRRALRRLLSNQSSFKGVTGAMRFDKDGEAIKDLFELTIQEREIRPFTKPAEPTKG